MKVLLICFSTGVLVLVAITAVQALPPTFQRTKIVDPTSVNDANTNTIGGALDQIGEVSDRHTILIYAGKYNITSAIHLDGTSENIDLVGVDRDAVIINMTGGGAAIRITSGSEQFRNNSIRNLTINTTNGPTIEIVQGVQVPKNIAIENVTISSNGTIGHGINGQVAEQVTIRNCLIETGGTSGGGHGIIAGVNTTVINTTVVARGTGFNGIHVPSKATPTIRGCSVTSASGAGLYMEFSSLITTAGANIERSSLSGTMYGVDVLGGNVLFFQDCVMAGSSSTNGAAVTGIRLNADASHPLGTVTALGCDISATATGQAQVIRGVEALKAPADESEVRFEDCEIAAKSINVVAGTVSGVHAAEANAARLVGGVITTAAVTDQMMSPNNEAPDVFDVENAFGGGLGVLLSGTRSSKWKGPVGTSERRRPVEQRTLNVALADPTRILPGAALHPVNQQTIAIPDDPNRQPDVYRVVSAKGSQVGTEVIHVAGLNWADERITDRITLNGTTVVPGVKPFKKVLFVVLPPGSANQVVSVGIENKLGLYQPLAAATDVIEQERKTSGASSYTVEAVGTVDATYSTVGVVLSAIGDSFQWAVLASE